MGDTVWSYRDSEWSEDRDLVGYEVEAKGGSIGKVAEASTETAAQWLVVDTGAWDFGQLWVQLGLALFVAAFVIGAAWQSRTALAATRAAERGEDGEARRQLRRWLAGYVVIVLLLVVAVWDMTTKPGL